METKQVSNDGEIITGEVPGDSSLLFGPAIDLLSQKIAHSDEKIAEGHESATLIDDEVVSTDSLSVTPNEDGKTYTARFTRKPKKGFERSAQVVAITLSVAGVLALANHIRVRRKSS